MVQLRILDHGNRLRTSLTFKALAGKTIESLNIDGLHTLGSDLLAEKVLDTVIVRVHLTHLLGEIASILTIHILLAQRTEGKIIGLVVTHYYDDILENATVLTNFLLEGLNILHSIGEFDDITLANTIRSEGNTRSLQRILTDRTKRALVCSGNSRKLVNINFLHNI